MSESLQFDPTGDLYDTQHIERFNILRRGDGDHQPRDPDTGLILVGTGHQDYARFHAGETAKGNQFQFRNGRMYSFSPRELAGQQIVRDTWSNGHASLNQDKVAHMASKLINLIEFPSEEHSNLSWAERLQRDQQGAVFLSEIYNPYIRNKTKWGTNLTDAQVAEAKKNFALSMLKGSLDEAKVHMVKQKKEPIQYLIENNREVRGAHNNFELMHRELGQVQGNSKSTEEERAIAMNRFVEARGIFHRKVRQFQGRYDPEEFGTHGVNPGHFLGRDSGQIGVIRLSEMQSMFSSRDVEHVDWVGAFESIHAKHGSIQMENDFSNYIASQPEGKSREKATQIATLYHIWAANPREKSQVERFAVHMDMIDSKYIRGSKPSIPSAVNGNSSWQGMARTRMVNRRYVARFDEIRKRYPGNESIDREIMDALLSMSYEAATDKMKKPEEVTEAQINKKMDSIMDEFFPSLEVQLIGGTGGLRDYWNHGVSVTKSDLAYEPRHKEKTDDQIGEAFKILGNVFKTFDPLTRLSREEQMVRIARIGEAVGYDAWDEDGLTPFANPYEAGVPSAWGRGFGDEPNYLISPYWEDGKLNPLLDIPGMYRHVKLSNGSTVHFLNWEGMKDKFKGMWEVRYFSDSDMRMNEHSAGNQIASSLLMDVSFPASFGNYQQLSTNMKTREIEEYIHKVLPGQTPRRVQSYMEKYLEAFKAGSGKEGNFELRAAASLRRLQNEVNVALLSDHTEFVRHSGNNYGWILKKGPGVQQVNFLKDKNGDAILLNLNDVLDIYDVINEVRPPKVTGPATLLPLTAPGPILNYRR